jgi:hypothetical protein
MAVVGPDEYRLDGDDNDGKATFTQRRGMKVALLQSSPL